MLPESKIASLAESIRDNGLREPITVTVDGLILDGRNRFKACQRAGVEPVTEVYQGDDLAEFVMDCNNHRRHIPTGQSAMAAALVLQADDRRRNGRWVRGSVKASNRSVTTAWAQRLNECGVILDHAPELAEKVRDGDLALDAAHKLAKARRDNTDSATSTSKASAPTVEDVALPFDPDWEERVAELRREPLWDDDSPKARAAQHTEIAKAVAVLSRYSGDSIALLMEDFDPTKLAAGKRLEINELQDVLRVVEGLIEWRKNL